MTLQLIRLFSVLLISFLCVAFAQYTPLTFERGACSTKTLQLQNGSLCGKSVTVAGETIKAYLGIPFAESTAGANRFNSPVPRTAWTDTLEATAFSAICPQNNAPASVPQSEDCLSINVWQPASTVQGETLPVLVYIPGGAFAIGSSAVALYQGGDIPLYDGAYLASTQNLIVVTFNYRLGVLGFLAGRARLDGNFGLQDQQLALAWVQENIAAFTGDPERVTLVGESAGAQSVALHLLSVPSSDAYFNAAILQSTPLGIPFKTLAEAGSVAELYLLAIGCKFKFNQLECLKNKSVAEILAAQKNPYLRLSLVDFGLAASLTWAPVIDGELVMSQPLQVALTDGLPKPTLFGANANEGTLFFAGENAKPITRLGYEVFATTLFGPAAYDRIAKAYPPERGADNTDQLVQISSDFIFTCSNRAIAGRASENVYYYEFTHVPSFNISPQIPKCDSESCHGDELSFVFHSAGGTFSFTPEEELLSQEMANYWGAFVRSGVNPNEDSRNTLEWPSLGTKQYLELSVPTARRALDETTCDFWDSLGYTFNEVYEAP